MATTQRFELTFEAEAEVARACCGQPHEFGECPNQDTEEKES